MILIDRIDTLAADYDAVFCDIWGVIHNGRAHFPAAAAALQRLRAAGKTVILVSNVPKPNGPIPSQLDRLGFPRDAYDSIVTSGDAIRAELAKRAPGPMYKIGPPQDASLWAGLGLAQSDLKDARFIGISGLNHDDRETPEDYADIVSVGVARDLEFLCANPDIVVRVGEKLIWCAGAVARDYAAAGGRVIMAGKPHKPIYDLAFAELSRRAGRDVPKSRVLAIGDGIGTDVLGAQGAGIDCLFIASGLHGEALKTHGMIDVAKAEAALAADQASARYAMAALT